MGGGGSLSPYISSISGAGGGISSGIIKKKSSIIRDVSKDKIDIYNQYSNPNNLSNISSSGIGLHYGSSSLKPNKYHNSDN